MREQSDPGWKGCRHAAAIVAVLVLGGPVEGADAPGLEFRGTPWAEAARPYGLEPALLYALTLVETRHSVAPGRVAPWPWAIHTPEGGHWFHSLDVARRHLKEVMARWPAKRIDVGAAQINIGWHDGKFDDPAKLLTLEYNLKIAARILDRAVESTDDPVLGVGRYHAWVDEERARAYGRRVWRMYQDVLLGRRGPAGRYVLGPQVAPVESASVLAERGP